MARKKYNRKILAVFSDTHAGSKYGLLNPDTKVFAEVPVHNEKEDLLETKLQMVNVQPNPFQAWLWGVYQKKVNETIALADGDELMVVHNGDLTQGWKYPEEMLAGIGVQMLLGSSNMLPWFEYPNLKHFKLVWGTASHILGDGSSPRVIHSLLKNSFPKVDVSLTQHSLINYGGVVFDIAHHGPSGGIRNWTRGNVARLYLQSLVIDAVEDDRRPPDVVVRSHFHVSVEEYITRFFKKYGRVRSEMVVTPSYQGINEWTRQATRSAGKSINGHVAFEIINGKLVDTYWFTDTRDVREFEVIK